MPRKGKGEGSAVEAEGQGQQPQQPQAPQQQQGGGRQKPAFEVRAGRIKATAWENRDKDGKPWYSVTLGRTYRDGEGNFKTATSLGVLDLLVAGECLRQIWLLIVAANGTQGGNGTGEANGEDIPF